MYEIWKQLGNDTRDAVFWVPILAVSLAVAVSSIAWPIVYYHTTKQRQMMENGYEEQTDSRGNQMIVKIREGK